MNTDNMEMPTPCQKCGNLFDLNDGTGSTKWFPNPAGNERTAEEVKDIVAKKRGYLNWTVYYDWIARDGELPSVVAQLIESAMEEAMELCHTKPKRKTAEEVERIAYEIYPQDVPMESPGDMCKNYYYREAFIKGYYAATAPSK